MGGLGVIYFRLKSNCQPQHWEFYYSRKQALLIINKWTQSKPQHRRAIWSVSKVPKEQEVVHNMMICNSESDLIVRFDGIIDGALSQLIRKHILCSCWTIKFNAFLKEEMTWQKHRKMITYKTYYLWPLTKDNRNIERSYIYVSNMELIANAKKNATKEITTTKKHGSRLLHLIFRPPNLNLQSNQILAVICCISCLPENRNQ